MSDVYKLRFLQPDILVSHNCCGSGVRTSSLVSGIGRDFPSFVRRYIFLSWKTGGVRFLFSWGSRDSVIGRMVSEHLIVLDSCCPCGIRGRSKVIGLLYAQLYSQIELAHPKTATTTHITHLSLPATNVSAPPVYAAAEEAGTADPLTS